MDFVQRNLINERNNLQIELAKANILIAQLNESAVEGLKDVVRKANADKANLSVAGAQVAASATKALRNMGSISHKNQDHHFGDDLKPFELSEQAQYISSLENAVIALAESMNMSVEDLIEYNSPGNLKRMAGMARAANDGTLKPMGGGVQPAGHLKRRIAMMLGASGLHGAGVDSEDRIVASQRNPRGGYNQSPSIINDKTPIEFNNPDVKPGTRVDYDRSVRFNSIRAQGDRTRAAEEKAAAAERASRSF
jgi:hypothetical protein